MAIFDSTHLALAGEKAAQREQITHVVIPTPRELTASCGLALKFDKCDLRALQQALLGQKVPAKFYYIDRENTTVAELESLV